MIGTLLNQPLRVACKRVIYSYSKGKASSIWNYIYIVTAHSAAKLGKALAVSREEETHVGSGHVFSVVVVVAASLAPVTVVMWSDPEQGTFLLFELMILAGPFLIVMRQVLLVGSPLQVQAFTFVVSLVVGIVGWIAGMVVSYVLVGGNAPVVVIWAGALAMAGFAGYGHAVEAQYEELMAVKRYERS